MVSVQHPLRWAAEQEGSDASRLCLLKTCPRHVFLTESVFAHSLTLAYSLCEENFRRKRGFRRKWIGFYSAVRGGTLRGSGGTEQLRNMLVLRFGLRGLWRLYACIGRFLTECNGKERDHHASHEQTGDRQLASAKHRPLLPSLSRFLQSFRRKLHIFNVHLLLLAP